MNILIHKIASFVIAPFIALLGLGGYAIPVQAPVPVVEKSVGASLPIETPVALFTTSLTNSITDTATSMSLRSGTTFDGTTLASSTYSFIIDEGTASQEFVRADCTNTTCTNMERGLSAITGTTTVSGLAKSHRRGASVKITDAPILLNLTRIINGIGTFPNIISYTGAKTPTLGLYNIPDWDFVKGYVDSGFNQGAATSTETNGGLVELGTLAEQASSFDGGINKPTVLQTKNSTSTCQVVGSYNVVASTTTGKIDKGCIDQTANYTLTGNSIFSGQNSFTGTTTMATTTQNGAMFGGNIVNNFTGGQTISGATTPQPVMMATTTGQVSLIESDVASTTAPFFGFAINNCSLGTTCYVQTDGIVKGFSGLTTGAEYYVSDTAGTLSTTIGTSENYVGRAISASAIQIEKNRTMQYLGSQGLTCSSNGITVVNQPWAKIVTIQGSVSDSGSGGIDGEITLSKTGRTTGNIRSAYVPAAPVVNDTLSGTWTGGAITMSYGGNAASCTATAYYYK